MSDDLTKYNKTGYIAAVARGHNAGVCLLKDGKIVFSIEEERVWKPNQLPYQNVMKFFKLRPNQGIIIACHE